MVARAKLKIVFMGTPEFAATILERLAAFAGVRICACYTMPDRPAGRGGRLTAPAVKNMAQSLGLEIRQPENFRNKAAIADLADLDPDFLVVAAYGLILPPAVLDCARMAPLNVHASLLPRWRGAAPIQRAIMAAPHGGLTGVSLMRMVREMDAGPIYATASEEIGTHTAGSLTARLAQLGADMLISSLPDIALGQLLPCPQDDAAATFAPKIQKSETWLSCAQPAANAAAFVRALAPRPGARLRVILEGQAGARDIGIAHCSPAELALETVPGRLLREADRLFLGCSDAWLELLRLRPQGRNEMSAGDFARGQRLPQGLCGETCATQTP